MKEEHWSCKNLKLSIRQTPGVVILTLEEPLAMRQVEAKCAINESTVASRSYHIKEAIVIGMRRLMVAAFEGGLVQISLHGALGALRNSSKKEPLTNWEPREEDTGSLTGLDA
jgi:hypothetical protein